MKPFQQVRFLPFLAILMFLFDICTRLYGGFEALSFLNHSVTFTTILFFPIWCVLNDIIAEIYGYKIARNLVLACVVGLILFSNISIEMIKIIPHYSNLKLDKIFTNMTLNTLYTFFTFIFAWRVNTYFLLKWKIMMRSKYFILRSLMASSIGIFISVALLNLHYLPIKPNSIDYIFITLNNIAWRILITGLMLFPAHFIVMMLKIFGEGRVYQEEFNTNPFQKLDSL